MRWTQWLGLEHYIVASLVVKTPFDQLRASGILIERQRIKVSAKSKEDKESHVDGPSCLLG